MRFYVISDNNDTCVGMRLAGIEGTVVHEPDEVHQALADVYKRQVLSLVTTVYKAPGLLFAFKDYDLLMSLPVRTGSLVASRLLMLYGVNLAFTLLTMVPAWVVYAVFAAPPWFYTCLLYTSRCV